MLRRLTEGSEPSFPPSARDAIILGGSVLELLDREVGLHACELLVARLPKAGPRRRAGDGLRRPDPRDRARLARSRQTDLVGSPGRGPAARIR